MKTEQEIYCRLVSGDLKDFAPDALSYQKIAESIKVKKKRTYPEQIEQKDLVSRCVRAGLPIHSIPNGGKRGKYNGYIERQMGMRRGVSDLFLQVASGGFHGFYIEMKAPGKKPSPEQLDFIETARSNGYKAEWFDSADKAYQEVERYVAYKKTFNEKIYPFCS